MDVSISQDTGLTLIELLVVMAILAVLAVGVTLVPIGHGHQATNRDKDRLQQQLQALQDLALYRRAPMGINLSSSDMQIMAWRAGGWQEQGGAIRWTDSVLPLFNRPSTASPDIVILPNQSYTAFQIRMGQSRCSGDGWGPVTCSD